MDNKNIILNVRNEKIINFYKIHPNINFELVNIYFIDLFEKILNINSNIFTESELINNILLNNQTVKDSLKGELKLKHTLSILYSSNEIIENIDINNCFDFILKRDDKPIIVFENKENLLNIENNITDIFIENVKNLNYCGIFISQHSGIKNKSNFNIEIVNNSIIIYIHYCEYNIDKIKSAIDIIDNVYNKIKLLNNGNDFLINKEIINEITKDYQNFISYKENIIKYIKENNNNIINNIENLKLDNISKYLPTFTNSSNIKNTITCNLCNIYTSQTLKGIAAHKKGCKKKQHKLITLP